MRYVSVYQSEQSPLTQCPLCAQLPGFENVHILSMSRQTINAAAFSSRGDWIALGCASLGQLLVWEWRSESYVLKQQGHAYDVSAVAFSPDGSYIATGADDNKVCDMGCAWGTTDILILLIILACAPNLDCLPCIGAFGEKITIGMLARRWQDPSHSNLLLRVQRR